MKLRALKDNLRFCLNKMLYDYQSSKKEQDFSFYKLKHLVIAKMDGKLGDTEVISPFISILKEHCPNLIISVLCPESLALLYEKILKVNTIVVRKKPSNKILKNALKKLSSLPPVDAVFSTEPNYRKRDFYLVHCLKPDFVIGIASNVAAININLKELCKGRHITYYFEKLLQTGGITKAPLAPYLPFVTNDSLSRVRALLPYKFICIAPCGASIHRHLKDETTAFILQTIIQITGYKAALLVESRHQKLIDKVAVIAGKTEAERFLAKLPDKLDTIELASIIHLSIAMISVDTANVHLACASQIPLFAIYSGTDKEGIIRWGPRPDFGRAQVFYAENKLIEDLNPSDIKEALEAFLSDLKG